jgi:hypothetical protein
MAYWGFQPEDSDTAHGRFNVIAKSAHKVLEAYFRSPVNSFGVWVNLGVLKLYLQAGLPVKVEILELAKNTLKNLAEDKKFINGFDKPGLIKETIKEASVVIDKLIGEDVDIEDKRGRTLKDDLGRDTFFDVNWLNQMEALKTWR